MRIDVLTLFPTMFDGPMTQSMLWKARDRGLLDLRLHDLRDWTKDKHRTADDVPYGGGGGMLMKAEPIVDAIDSVLEGEADVPVIYLTPQGRVLSHAIVTEFAKHPRLILLCGHYEGIDDRARQIAITDEISIGDYVLTGGELAAMVVIDAVVRHIPGVLGAEGGADAESHADGILEAPHYTRPPVFRGLSVPLELQNGDHGKISAWRRREGLRRTWQNRPDLLRKAQLSEDDQYLLATFADEDAQKTKPHDK